MDRIYRDEKRIADFKVGFRQAMKCAAEFVGQWEGKDKERKYRLDDLLLFKFNLGKRLRKARREQGGRV